MRWTGGLRKSRTRVPAEMTRQGLKARHITRPLRFPRTIIHRAGDCCLRPQQKQPCVISCCVAHESCRHGRRRERPHFRRCSDGLVHHGLAGRRAALGCQMRCYRTNAITIYFSSRRDEPVSHNDIVMNHVVLTNRWDASEPPAQKIIPTACQADRGRTWCWHACARRRAWATLG